MSGADQGLVGEQQLLLGECLWRLLLATQWIPLGSRLGVLLPGSGLLLRRSLLLRDSLILRR